MSQPLPMHPGDTNAATEALTRRTFLGATSAGVLSCLLAACGGDSTGPNTAVDPPPTGSVTFSGGVLTVRLSMIPRLTATNGHQVIGMSDGATRADLVILNIGGTYKAFSSICTHDRCTVTGYTGTRLVCPCHGSQFNQNGQVVVGPAPSALREFAVAHATVTGTLTIAV
ncbi:MAG: ubiquinol-cytochrome c reductase iron-sulfur subunit [Gemmatimonas sp.]